MIDLGIVGGTVKSRRIRRRLLVLFLTTGVIWAGWAWWAEHRYQGAMAEIEADIVASRFGSCLPKAGEPTGLEIGS